MAGYWIPRRAAVDAPTMFWEPLYAAWGWLADRQSAEAAREILAATEQTLPLLHSEAIGVAQGWTLTESGKPRLA